jgi:hypothetical protein
MHSVDRLDLAGAGCGIHACLYRSQLVAAHCSLLRLQKKTIVNIVVYVKGIVGNEKQGGVQTFRYRFGHEIKTFWYRSRISLIENRLFRFDPESALLGQIERMERLLLFCFDITSW